MARILFLMMPEPGHLVPTLRVAASLRARGHHVSYLTAPPFASFLRQAGFDAIVPPGVTIDSGTNGGGADDGQTEMVWSPRQSGDAIGRELEAQAIAIGSTWPELVVAQLTAARPDLIACDWNVAPRTPDGSPRGFAETIAHVLDRPVLTINTSLPDADESLAVPDLVLCPVEFERPDGRAYPPGRHYCEPSIWRERPVRAQSPAAPRVRPHQRTAYCSLGTQSTTYTEAVAVLRTVIAAFDGLTRYHVIIAGGMLYDALARERERLPENVQIVRSAPQLDILERADVIITHGGLGTLKEAVMARVPAIVIPFRFDQPANGRRVEYHGIGRACAPSACSVAWLREAMRELTEDDGVRARLAELSAVFQAREAEQRAGQLLSGFASPP